MRTKWMCVLLFMLFGILPRGAVASVEVLGGVPVFGMGFVPAARVDTAGCWILQVWAYGAGRDGDESATVRISVGAGTEVVEGDTVFAVNPTKYPWKNLKLRHIAGGSLKIIGSLRIPAGTSPSYDYCESVLELDYSGEKILSRDNRWSQRICVRDGKRFRFGGEFLVAIEDDETESPRQVTAMPALTSAPDIVCHGCGLRDTIAVPVVVTVGKDGLVTWVMPPGPEHRESGDRVWDAVVTGLKRYRFRPALSPEGPIAEYAKLRVRVVPSR